MSTTNEPVDQLIALCAEIDSALALVPTAVEPTPNNDAWSYWLGQCVSGALRTVDGQQERLQSWLLSLHPDDAQQFFTEAHAAIDARFEAEKAQISADLKKSGRRAVAIGLAMCAASVAGVALAKKGA